MFTDKKNNIGEHFSVGEELLNDVSVVEQKCAVVEKAIKEGYFTQEEALVNYKVSKIDYFTFLLRKMRAKMVIHTSEEQFFEAVTLAVSIYSPSAQDFAPDKLKSAQKIKEMAEKALSGTK